MAPDAVPYLVERRCERSEAAVRDQIASLAVSGESIYVWGTGTHTLHLTNPEQGIDQTYRVTIGPGESVTRRLGLR